MLRRVSGSRTDKYGYIHVRQVGALEIIDGSGDAHGMDLDRGEAAAANGVNRLVQLISDHRGVGADAVFAKSRGACAKQPMR